MIINNWKNINVLITGASGLVGSWLVKELISVNANVFTLIRDLDPQTELFRSGDALKTNIINGKLEDFSTCERAIADNEIDTVFHLGAQTLVGTALRSPRQTFESNIRGTYNLLEACRLHKKTVSRIIIASSDKAYGSSSILPYTENMPLNGQHPYDVSKSCTDLIATSYYHSYRLPIAIARCGNIFGGGDLNWSRIVPGTIRSLIENKKPKIRSDGSFRRDYIFVEDVVRSYITLAEQIHKETVIGEAFNFGPNKPVSAVEIVQIISELMQKTDLTPEILNESKAEIKDQWLSSQKAIDTLNWNFKFSLEEGLSKTISWYKNFLNSKISSNEVEHAPI